MDRWSITTVLNYLEQDKETEIVLAKNPHFNTKEGRETVARMVTLADLTRSAFSNGDLSTVMSPRTVITWAQNTQFFGNQALAFELTFLNKCDPVERDLLEELYQRVFDRDLAADASEISSLQINLAS